MSRAESDPPERLGFAPSPRLARDCRILSEALGRALARTLGPVRRRDLLQHLLWGGAALACHPTVDVERILAAASGQFDRRLLDDLQVVAEDHARRMYSDAPRDLLPQVDHHLTYVHAMLRGRRPSWAESRLSLIAGTLAAVAGRLSFNLGNRGDAHTHYMAAEAHALEAGDHPLQAYVLGQRSHLYPDLWRDGQASGTSPSLRLLDAAHTAAGSSSSVLLRTWLSVRRAEEHAIQGDARAAHRDLDAADRALGSAVPGGDTFFVHWSESPHLAAYRGNLLQLLGRTKEATAVIEDSLSTLSPSLVFCRCSELIDLAAACIKDKNIERACWLLQQALDLSSERSLVAPAQRAIGLSRHLRPWRDTPAVHDLDEHIHELAWATA